MTILELIEKLIFMAENTEKGGDTPVVVNGKSVQKVGYSFPSDTVNIEGEGD